MEKINCDLCGSSNFKIITKQKDIVHKTDEKFYDLVSCNNCNLNFVNPRPTIEEISKYYGQNYSFYKNENFLRLLFNNVINVLIKFKPFIYLVNFIPSKKIKELLIYRIKPNIKYPVKINHNDFILDIGCGSGDTIHWWKSKLSVNSLSKKYKNIFAIEPDLNANSKIKIKIENKSTYLKNFNCKFDHIRMNWSLEHCHKPSNYFKYISENLSNDGKFILTVPNYNGIIYKIDKSNLELPIHLFYFTPEIIKLYCDKFKLKITSMNTFSYPGMFLFSSKINMSFNSFSRLSLIDFFEFQKSLNIFDNFNLGNDMIFVIEKNYK
jgi:SAM-dependent methyltransferase